MILSVNSDNLTNNLPAASTPYASARNELGALPGTGP